MREVAKYTLRKDGKLYNNEKEKYLSIQKIRGVQYYRLFIDGKVSYIQVDPYYIMKGVYPLDEYDIDIEDGIESDKMFMAHMILYYQKRKMYKHTDSDLLARIMNEIVENYQK